jgi:hypothetical protein
MSDPYRAARDAAAAAGLNNGRQPRQRKKRKPAAAAPGHLANYRLERKGDDDIKAGLSAAAIRRTLHALTGGWPRRVGDRLFAVTPEPGVLWLDGTEDLFAWIGGQLPDDEGGNGVRWTGGEDKVSRAEFAASCRQAAERYESIEAYPHEPPLPGAYYLHPDLPKKATGKALAGLLARFRPATAVDADLVKAQCLTPFWGGPPGQRPAFLLDSEEDDREGGRGVGKSKLCQALAHLAGGHVDVRPGEDYDKLMTRLLSPAALDRRVVLLDNVKTLRFSWADLEGFITADVISGRGLYVGEARRPNTLTWFITINRASLSRDMAQRCVPIRVRRPPHDPSWESGTWGYIEKNRWAIIADILAELRRPVPALTKYSRWAAWEQAVLARVKDPAAAQKAIVERQGALDDDQAEADLVRQEFVRELDRRGHKPEEEAVWIPAKPAAAIVNQALDEKYPVNRAGVYLGTLTIAELRKSNRSDWGRGWCWRGARCPLDAAMVQLLDPDRDPFH